MFRFYYFVFLGSVIFGLLSFSSLDAGTLIPVTSEQRTAIAEKDHFVTVDVNNQVAVTRVTQIFINRSQADLEAIYQFTLPLGARIHSFAMWIKGIKMYGAIVEKIRGREIYETIVRKKIDPALLEHVSGNTYKIRVFPVQAGKEQRIELAYWQVLPYDSGTVSYLYPLKEGQESLESVNFAFTMKVVSTIPISTIACETHTISKSQQDSNLVTVKFEDPKLRFDRDLKIVYALEKKKLGLDVICYRPDKGKPGYFMALVTPPETQDKVVPKAMTFVLDISRSMAGEKLEQVKNALSQWVNSLRPQDLFNLIVFETEVRSFARELLHASVDNKKNALQFISEIVAEGGTNLYEALQLALSSQPPNMPHVVVVLTDGRPSVGEIHPNLILEGTKKLCTEETRLFTFGVGVDVDQNLLDALARENKGTSLFLRSGENIEMPVSQFFKKIANPVLTQIKLDFQDACVSRIFPRTITELFQGTQILITGRYKNSGTFPVKMDGFREKEKVEVMEKVSFPDQENENELIGRLWAGENIDYLLYAVRQGEESNEVVDEILLLSKTWGIITPYTSYLVLESEEDYKRWDLTPNDPAIKIDRDFRPLPPPRVDLAGEFKSRIELQRELWEAKQIIRSVQETGVKIPLIVGGSREKPLDGVIQAVSASTPLVIINLGSDEGVSKGYEFTVYRGGEYIGRVAVDEVYKDACAARVIIELTPKNIQKGDKVTTRIGGGGNGGRRPWLNSYEFILIKPYITLDEIPYNTLIFTDGKEVEYHCITANHFGESIYIKFEALPETKDIRVEFGFYYVELNVREMHKTIKLGRINPFQLIAHLKSLKPDLALNRIEKIMKEEVSKLKSITKSEKDKLIQYVKNEMKDVSDEKRREILELIENIF